MRPSQRHFPAPTAGPPSGGGPQTLGSILPASPSLGQGEGGGGRPAGGMGAGDSEPEAGGKGRGGPVGQCVWRRPCVAMGGGGLNKSAGAGAAQGACLDPGGARYLAAGPRHLGPHPFKGALVWTGAFMRRLSFVRLVGRRGAFSGAL
jgi:hypothetical protein